MSGVELLLAATTAVSAASAISQGMQQSSMARYNAGVAEQEAAAARQQAALAETRQRKQAGALLSTQRAAYAASGVTLEGSPLEVLGETAAEAELDALLIRYDGEINARRATSQAGLHRMQGQAAAASSAFGAGSSLLTGANAYAMRRSGAGLSGGWGA